MYGVEAVISRKVLVSFYKYKFITLSFQSGRVSDMSSQELETTVKKLKKIDNIEVSIFSRQLHHQDSPTVVYAEAYQTMKIKQEADTVRIYDYPMHYLIITSSLSEW